MTHFAIAIVTAAVQVTLVALLAMLVIAWAGRRSPRTGANLAAAALVACALLSIVAVAPLPHWWAWDAPTGPHAQPMADAVDDAVAASSSNAGGWRIPLGRLSALLSAAARSPTEPESGWNAWTIIGGVFLTGVVVEIGRLLAGLWTVAGIRRRSTLVNDANLIAQVDEIRREFGATRAVAVRQSAAVGTAATIGWRRPMILLAADWPAWDSAERRAVLAHELAHVRRRDYLTSLLAAVCRAPHFYHPLVRRLAARLRLHQELAADSLAAAVAGGREGYLRALARLALRQDAAVVAGMARPFLSDRSSLIRRIAMLHVTEDNRPLNRPTRWVLAAMLGLAAFGASAIRGQAQGPVPGVVAVDAADVQPFDLSHVPARANLLIAVRPAGVLARPGMKPVAERLNGLLSEGLNEIAFPSDQRILVQDIEQIVTSQEGAPMPPQPGKPMKLDGPQQVTMQLSFLIRMTHDFDWPGFIRAGAAASKAEIREVRPGLFLVSGTDAACYLQVVDKRTMCVLEQPFSGKTDIADALLERSKPAADAAAAWGPAWAKAQRSAAVIAVDNRKGFWTGISGPNKPNPNLLAALGRPSHMIACLDLADNATAHVYMSADESVPGQKRCHLAALAGELAKGLSGNGTPTSSAAIALFFLGDSTITYDGTTDIMDLRMKEAGVPVSLARLLLMLKAAIAFDDWGP